MTETRQNDYEKWDETLERGLWENLEYEKPEGKGYAASSLHYGSNAINIAYYRYTSLLHPRYRESKPTICLIFSGWEHVHPLHREMISRALFTCTSTNQIPLTSIYLLPALTSSTSCQAMLFPPAVSSYFNTSFYTLPCITETVYESLLDKIVLTLALPFFVSSNRAN